MLNIILDIREIQIKTTVRYRLISTRMAIIIILKMQKITSVGKDVKNLVQCWWKYKMLQLLWKMVWCFFKKLSIELPYDPAIPLWSIYSKKLIEGTQIDTCMPVFIVALLAIAKGYKHPICPSTNEWITKMLCIYVVWL